MPQIQAPDLNPNPGVQINVLGYVLDLAFLVKFDGALKPINDCAQMRARTGSSLIVTEEETIYTPISDAIPDVSQRDKLMPFVGTAVAVTGRMFDPSDIKAFVVEQFKKTDRKP